MADRGIGGHVDSSDMERKELDQLRQSLVSMLEGMAQPLRNREEIAIDNAPDTIDQVQNAAERELAIRRLESNSSRMQNIKLALDRIEEGSYGTCLMCDGEIGLKRLRAIPWAVYCVRCQDLADRERVSAESEIVWPLAHLKDVA